MSFTDLERLPKSLTAVLPDSGSSFIADTPSTSSSVRNSKQQETSEMANRHGSLSSTGDSISSGEASKSLTVSSAGTTSNESNMDTQLATLRQEMHNLRQMDLSLLTQLWALNESIQGFRARLEDRRKSRSPSPPKIFRSQGDTELDDILANTSKAYISIKSGSYNEGIRVSRPTTIQNNTKRDVAHMHIKPNFHQEKSIRKTRPKKKLYEYEENHLISEAAFDQVNARSSNTIPQQIHTGNDLPRFHQQLVQNSRHSQTDQNRKAHPVPGTPCVISQPKTSKGAIPKILSILQRKQRAPPPPPPLHKSH